MNALGFHIPGMYDKVLDIQKCWLQDDLANRIRNSVRATAWNMTTVSSTCATRGADAHVAHPQQLHW